MYARYTEVLKDLMDNPITRQALEAALSTYPLYQGKKTYDLIPTREELNRRLLNHYKYREIGFETVGRFLDELQITMEEIMGIYNERYKTIEIMADIENPFDNVDITETYEEQRSDQSSGSGTGKVTNSNTSQNTSSASTSGESNTQTSGTNSQTATTESTSGGSETNSQTVSSNSSESGNTTHNGKSVESDTPQDSLSIGAAGIDTIEYASMAKWDKSTDSSSTTREDESTTNGTTTRTGSEGSESSTEGTSTTTGKDTSTSTTEGTASSTASGTSESENSSISESSGTTSHTIRRTGQQGISTFANDIDEYRRKAIIDVTNEIINDTRINDLFMLVY